MFKVARLWVCSRARALESDRACLPFCDAVHIQVWKRGKEQTERQERRGKLTEWQKGRKEMTERQKGLKERKKHAQTERSAQERHCEQREQSEWRDGHGLSGVR